MMPEDPFSNWADIVNLPVYSSDRKKLGFVRKTLPDYLLVKKGLIDLSSYLIPKSLAKSLDKKGIKLMITAHEAQRNYSLSKMKHLALNGEVPKSSVKERIVYDRIQTLRYSTTRNRIAACVAIASGILFIFSGYRANIEIYGLIREQLIAHTAKDFWSYAVIPVGFLAILSQLGGFTVLIGAGLLAANRVSIGKFLVMIGTGQGLITILLHVLLVLLTGSLILENNYVTWLTTTATGLGIILAIAASYIAKGAGPNIYVRIAKFLLRRRKSG